LTPCFVSVQDPNCLRPFGYRQRVLFTGNCPIDASSEMDKLFVGPFQSEAQIVRLIAVSALPSSFTRIGLNKNRTTLCEVEHQPRPELVARRAATAGYANSYAESSHQCCPCGRGAGAPPPQSSHRSRCSGFVWGSEWSQFALCYGILDGEGVPPNILVCSWPKGESRASSSGRTS
jgi:hypothetical protein